jgi:serine/threonine protein kinase
MNERSDDPDPLTADVRKPVHGDATTSEHSPPSRSEDAADTRDRAPATFGPHDPAAQFGHFHILQEVGRGGMGVVYRAVDESMHREVAVKVLGGQYAPNSPAARRFVDEARITGQLQHPGIPAVYQVAALPDGRPYLAMKLIRGETLDRLIRSRAPIDVPATLEAIAQAVGFAHARRVVHRDLKPANIMVGPFGEVQLMDWGLAKVLGDPPAADPAATASEMAVLGPAATDSRHTRAGSVLGTPAYMAPEQAAGEVDRIDARTDVFGLGAILCAMLTGTPPYNGSDAEVVYRNAADGRTEPALGRLDECGADADLVALCKRCLARDPADRPASGDAVARSVADLRRAAEERARRADRDRLAAEVRATEQAARRRAVQRAALAVTVVLLLGLAGTTAGLLHANAARRNEEVHRRRAEAKEREAAAALRFLEERVFAAARPRGQVGGLGSDVTLRDAIVASLPALADWTDQPGAEARLRLALGETFLYLGDARAVAQNERARELYEQERGPDHPDTLLAMHSLANSYVIDGRHGDALRLREATYAARRRVLGPDHVDTLRTMNALANSYYEANRQPEALALREEALATLEAILPADDPLVLATVNSLGTSYAFEGRHEKALEMRERAVNGRRRVLGPDHPDTLMSMNNLANSYVDLRRHQDGLRLRQKTVAGMKRILPPDHPSVLLAVANLANSFSDLKLNDDALRGREEVLTARRRALPADDPLVLLAMHDVADSLFKLGRLAEALDLTQQCLAGRRRALPADHADIAISLAALARILMAMGRGGEAVAAVDEYVTRMHHKGLSHDLTADVLRLRLSHFRAAGDVARCRETAELWEKLGPTDAEGAYTAARFRAIAAAVRASPGEAAARRAAEEDAAAATRWLRKAVALGLDMDRVRRDPDLAVLRGRDDFRRLVDGAGPRK